MCTCKQIYHGQFCYLEDTVQFSSSIPRLMYLAGLFLIVIPCKRGACPLPQLWALGTEDLLYSLQQEKVKAYNVSQL